MLFDEIILKNEGFELRIRHDILKAGNLLDHSVYLRSSSDVGSKIRPDTVVQVNRLPNVHYGVV